MYGNDAHTTASVSNSSICDAEPGSEPYARLNRDADPYADHHADAFFDGNRRGYCDCHSYPATIADGNATACAHAATSAHDGYRERPSA
jgi:hypothetical protein